jgi:hypothetical protein
VCIESLHSNGRFTDNIEPIIASLPSNEQQTLILLLLRAFLGFYGINNYCMGETHTPHYETNLWPRPPWLAQTEIHKKIHKVAIQSYLPQSKKMVNP